MDVKWKKKHNINEWFIHVLPLAKYDKISLKMYPLVSVNQQSFIQIYTYTAQRMQTYAAINNPNNEQSLYVYILMTIKWFEFKFLVLNAGIIKTPKTMTAANQTMTIAQPVNSMHLFHFVLQATYNYVSYVQMIWKKYERFAKIGFRLIILSHGMRI